MPTRFKIRKATIKDLDSLVDLETRGFNADNFTPEQFNYLLTKANSTILLITTRGRVAGEAILLWRKGRKVARLYNIVIDPSMQGMGLGDKLLAACEREALAGNYRILSLEVRTDNTNAIDFYKKRGYRITEKLPRYYSGRAAGYRMVKTLGIAPLKGMRIDVPYYAQTLDFTCGPACLMMAFKYFNPEIELNRVLEIELWREATLVFMTSGFGGTGPFGMALSARKRGYTVKVLLSARQTPFFSSVRIKDKREVIRLLHNDLKNKALALGVKDKYYDFSLEDIAREMQRGKLAIVLISTYRLHGDRAPHWVVVTGYDSEFIYCHDPYEKFYIRNRKLARDVKIHIEDFRKMRRYGKNLYKCVLFIGPAKTRK